MAVWGPNPEQRPHSLRHVPAPGASQRWWDIFLVPVLGMAGAAILTTIAALGGILIVMGRSATVDEIGIVIKRQASEPLAVYAVETIVYLGVVVGVVILLALRGHRLGSVYFGTTRRLFIFAAILTGAALATFVLFILSLLPAGVQQQLIEQNDLLMPETRLETAILFFIAVLLAPFVEELYFRGVVLRALGARIPFALSAVVTAAFFSLTHGHLFILPGAGGWVLSGVIFILGVVLAYWARWSGSLRAPVLVHATYNAVLFAPMLTAIFSDSQT